MPFVYRNLALPPGSGEESLLLLLAEKLKVPATALHDLTIIRKGVDARKKGQIKLVYTLSFLADDNLYHLLGALPDIELCPEPQPEAFTPVRSDGKIVIVGCGPAGMFAALRLNSYGLTPTIIERGEPVEQRASTVARFWKDGTLDRESNVQFGEGGAGTFSDGKLTCRSKDPLIPWVLGQLVTFGAEPELRYLAKPHIGTDRLKVVVKNIRRHLLERGCTIRFGCRMDDLVINDGRVVSLIIDDGIEIPCDHLILASGHSARDTYEMLERHQVPLQRKPFAMGLRVEHPQELINRIQYGCARHPAVPVADYAATWNNPVSGRSAYSFCMCPGGVVIAGTSEPGGVVTNGMSGRQRNSPYANSALVVNVREDDFEGGGALAGMRLQRRWEQRAFEAGGGNYHAPAQNLLRFLKRPGSGGIATSYRPGVRDADLADVLPGFIIETLREGIVDFDRRLKGFVSAEATLIGIESRTSAPVRILRDAGESVGVKRLYPTGEGAGYAGGIMSSAIDGIKMADIIAARLRQSTA